MKDTYYLDPRVAAEYDAEHRGRQITEDDVPFYVELAKKAAADGQSVLELACGTGRVTLPIAAAGVHVTGFDNSPAMLEIARSKSGKATNPRWLEAEMTSFEMEERFGLVIIPFRSFLHLPTVADQKACLRRIHDHLIDGGRLALNFFNPNVVTIAEWLTTKRGSREQLGRLEGKEEWSSREYSTAEQMLNETRVEEQFIDANAVISRVYRNMRLRYVYRYEMEHLLSLCGFEIEALYGWFDRRPFTDHSQELVWIARKISKSDQ
jgi:SAM-dependent methyltransferase